MMRRHRHLKGRGPLKPPPLSPKRLAELAAQAEGARRCLPDQCLRIIGLETIDQIADEVAVNLPSPGEVAEMAVSDRAKELRRGLLDAVHGAEDVEAARVAVFTFLEEVQASGGIA